MMNNSSPPIHGLTRHLAEFVSKFVLRDSPPAILENAKLAILDCLGVAVLAASQEIGQKLRRFALSHAARGPCTVWGTEIQTCPRDAALLNGTLAHGIDFDDRNHSSTYTLASAVGVAEGNLASGQCVLEAFVAGREIRASLDAIFAKRSSGIGPGARGWHSNGILGPIASACAAGKVLGLQTGQLVSAIGLAAGSCGALTSDGGTMAKPFRVGHAAAAGVTSALLAQEGFTSDEAILEGRYGLLEALGPLDDDLLDSLGATLGSYWDLSHRPRIKPFASCTATHQGIEAMLRIVAKGKIEADEVERIECDLRFYPLVRREPTSGYEGKFSMAFCLAVALVYGRVNPGDFTDARLHEPDVKKLISLVHHQPNAENLVIILKNGTRRAEPLRPPSGLVDWPQVYAKFTQSLSPTFSRERTEQIAERITHLEELTTIQQLTELLHTS